MGCQPRPRWKITSTKSCGYWTCEQRGQCILGHPPDLGLLIHQRLSPVAGHIPIFTQLGCGYLMFVYHDLSHCLQGVLHHGRRFYPINESHAGNRRSGLSMPMRRRIFVWMIVDEEVVIT